MSMSMKIAYADPPYPGQAIKHYASDPSGIAAAEVDHTRLIHRLTHDYPDGWALSTSSVMLPAMYLALLTDDIAAGLLPTPKWDSPLYMWQWSQHAADYLAHERGVRTAVWVKPFAVFKPNVNPAYAWEPVIWRGGRMKRGRAEPTVRDWVAANITLRRGTHGAKPDAFAFWLFDLLGLQPGDTLDDLYPGSGAVSRAWAAWQRQLWRA